MFNSPVECAFFRFQVVWSRIKYVTGTSIFQPKILTGTSFVDAIRCNFHFYPFVRACAPICARLRCVIDICLADTARVVIFALIGYFIHFAYNIVDNLSIVNRFSYFLFI